jgi:hypothetical protein
MTFIPKPDTKSGVRTSFRPIKPAFRERQYGSEFNKWELALLKEFSYAKTSKNPIISGSVVYDSSLGRGRFLLIPATHLPQDYVICECASGVPVPANLSYVTITGRKKVFYDYWEIIVDNISFEKMRLPIKPEIDFRDFQEVSKENLESHKNIFVLS